MRCFLLTLSIGLISFLAVGCVSTTQSSTEFVTAIPTQNQTPASTPFLTLTLTPTQQTSPKPTPVISRFNVTEIIPSHRCEIERDKELFTASWKNDSEFTYAYYPVRPLEPEVELTLMSGGTVPKVELQWVSHNVETGNESPDKPFINFDSTFWERNRINNSAVNPELAGFFSPSGKYVIYRVFLGESFTPSAKNQIWVAEVSGKQRWKIDEFGGNAVYIYRAAWFENETKVIFNTAYEGPTGFSVSEFKTGKVKGLSEISQFNGVTEETWRLSPDGKTLAVVSYDRQLLLVSLKTGKMQVVETIGGSFPQWSNDGKFLFYWWSTEKDNWWEMDELRVYEISSGKISTMLDRFDLIAGFRDYQGDDNCVTRDYYLLEGNYAVSPNQKSILLWVNGLYLLMKK